MARKTVVKIIYMTFSVADSFGCHSDFYMVVCTRAVHIEVRSECELHMLLFIASLTDVSLTSFLKDTSVRMLTSQSHC